MVARIWRTEYQEEKKAKLIDFANQVSKPYLASRQGNRGVFFLSRGKSWLTITLWDDEHSIAEMERASEYQELVSQISTLGVLVGKSSTENYEVN